MKTTWKAAERRTRLSAALFATVAVLAAPSLACAGGAADLYYERSVLRAAGERCGLFAPDLAAALEASSVQARGAALRAGADAAALAQIRSRAQQKAAAVPCGSADMRTAAARTRSAFEGYARLYRMSFPGDVAAWRADRAVAVKGASWSLSQSGRLGADAATLGLAGVRGQPAQLTVAVALAGPERPYAARLVVRDVTRTSGPYLGKARGGPTAALPLSSRIAPRSACRAFIAAERAVDPQLSPQTGKPALVFRFPAAATAALAGLDPREAVAVEFLFAGRGGDAVRQAHFEVGDFAAGQAFLRIARR